MDDREQNHGGADVEKHEQHADQHHPAGHAEHAGEERTEEDGGADQRPGGRRHYGLPVPDDAQKRTRQNLVKANVSDRKHVVHRRHRLRGHGRAIEDAAAAAVILDALVLNDAIVPDRERAAGPGIADGRLRRLDHVEQDAEDILAHDPADALDIGDVGFVDRDPFAAGHRMRAHERHLEGRHAHPRVGRFLRIEIAVGDMPGRVRRLNDGQGFKIGREQRIEVLVDPGRIAEHRVAAEFGQLHAQAAP